MDAKVLDGPKSDRSDSHHEDEEADAQGPTAESYRDGERAHALAARYSLLRLRRASMLELGALTIVVGVLVWAEFVSALRATDFNQQMALIETITNPTILGVGSVYFLEWFTFFLTGRSIMVQLLAAGRLESLRLGPIPFPVSLKDISATGIESSENRSEKAAAQSSAWADDVQMHFARFVARSEEATRSAQRRPNALLFVGRIVAGVGLVFFLVTLPGFIAPDSGAREEMTAAHLWRGLLDLTPRLLMLVFIQLLAGFFLRQYRSSMEELRYYEGVLRFRESQLLSYLIRRQRGNGGLDSFARMLLENRDFSALKQGETTLVLEAQKGEVNEFKGVFESFLDFARATARPADKREESKPERDATS